MAASALAKGSCLAAALTTPAIPSTSFSSRDAIFRNFSGLTLSDKFQQNAVAMGRSTSRGELVCHCTCSARCLQGNQERKHIPGLFVSFEEKQSGTHFFQLEHA
jgi:hypothetical protein